MRERRWRTLKEDDGIIDGHAGFIEMIHLACRLLSCPKRLVIVPGATHLFEIPAHLSRWRSMRSRGFSNTFILRSTRAQVRKQRSIFDENHTRGRWI